MSAKCNYSAKFLPLIKKVQLENLEGFKDFLNEYFNDSERLYDMFTRGATTGASPLTINKIEQVDNKLGLRISDDVDSTVEFYIGNRSQHENMLRSFRAKLIESSVFNRYTEEFVNANAPINNTTLLNSLIFDYKKELLLKIASYLNISELANSISSEMEPELLTNVVKNITEQFESSINSSIIDKNSTFNLAYDAYVVLSKFDQLLKEQVPFIEIKPELRKSKDFYVDKYIYKGPNIKHYTGFSTSEHMNAEEHASDLSKILLDYFPEINEVGQEINNTAITLSGFNSVMTKLVASIQESSIMQEYIDELHKGVQADISLLIDAYLSNLQKNTILSDNHRTYLQNKLRSIKKFIYAEGMNEDIKAMFTQMMLKTVPASYTAYEYDSVSKTISSKDLKERPISQQAYALKSLIQASSYFLKTNPNIFKSKLDKYGIKISDNNIIINSINEGIPSTFTIAFEQKEEGFNYRIFGSMSDQLLSDLMYDFMSFVVPDDIDSVIRQVYPVNKWSKTELLLPLLATTLLEAANNPNINHKNELIDLSPFVGDIRTLANVMSVINGSDTINVIKNAEGNNLPLYQIISLIYNHHAIIDRIRLQSEVHEENENILQYNLLYNSNNFLLSPKIRSDVSLNNKIKKPANLTVSEVFRLAIMHDFYQNLTKDGVIGLQPTTFSDKNKHFLVRFNLNQTLDTPIGSINLKTILNDFLNKKGTLDPVVNILQETRKNQINSLVKNILFDYNTAFRTELKTLQEVDSYIERENLSLETIQKSFNSVGIDFFLDIHAYKTKLSKFPRTNETIKSHFEIFNSLDLTTKRIDLEKRKFLKDLLSNDFELNINTDSFLRSVFLKPEFSNFVDSSTGEVIIAKVTDRNGKNINLDTITPDMLLSKQYKVILNPILEAYYLTDTLLSNEYNNLMIGGVYAHPNKNNDGILDSEEYNEYSEANRLIAQYKRMVIYGATYHPYAQNLKNGVAPIVKIAVINDESGTVWNMLGEENKYLDTMDGSGFASPIQSREENNSLLDARVGKNKKTIMHDIDSRYGRPTLLKWAEFEITNEGRRTSFMSQISQEKLFKKMHNIVLNKQFDITQYYDIFKNSNYLIYFKDYRMNKYYRIDNISNVFNLDGSISVIRTTTETDKNGIPTTNISKESFIINTLYDLDQVFGGAWAMQIDQNLNSLQYTEANIDILEEIVHKEELKDKFIAYLVNKSAIKVGAGNINDSTKFSNDDALTTIEMSTRFGGVQMNADHDLNMAEVTEMTQMISALEQNGYTHELATQIYKEIGQVVKESMQDLSNTINENDKDKLYTILGKSLVQSFMSDDKDTLGLAQSFVYLANESFKNANLDYKLPFSASTINGAFVSTTTSNLVKKGIRRKYAGVASVLVPSNNMMQYWSINGYDYKFEELAELVASTNIQHEYDENKNIIKSNIERVINDIIIDGEQNPFIIPTTPLDIDFEDTIIMKDQQNNIIVDENNKPIVIKIDSFEKYDRIRHNIDTTQYFKWITKPKNLKQSDTKFDVSIGYDESGNEIFKTFSIYDLDSVRASHFLNSRKNNLKIWSDLTNNERIILESALNFHPALETKLNVTNILKSLQKRTQLQLDMLSEGRILNNTAFNIINPNVLTVNATNVKVIPAQIIMGKLNSHKLGLLPGDSISKIKEEGAKFFYNRMQGYYNIENSDKTSYDIVLFDGAGKQFYVKVLRSEDVQKAFPNSELSFNNDFKIIDNIVYYDGKEIANGDQKQFYKYTDLNGQTHDLIILNSIDRLGELRKSEVFSSYQYNYTSYNYDMLLKHQYNYNLINNIPIKLHTVDAIGNPQIATFNISNNLSINYNSLNQNEIYNFNERLWKLAQNQFETFNKQLLYIGARIPTQSMQSFMPMEIVAFTDSEVNDVYVPKVQTWLQGSDYDIDKLYILGYSIKNNGTIHSISKLSETYDINEVRKLPLPNGKTYNIDEENGYYLTNDDVQQVLRDGNLSIFSSILNANFDSVSFDEEVPKEAAYKFLKDLNKHSTSILTDEQISEGLKNRVVDGIFDVVLDPRNQINLHVPINMDDQQEAAKKSILGKEEKRRSADNPGSKFVMQIQNMVGKEVIGITAVSMKTYFLLSNYYNTEYRKIIDLLKYKRYDDIVKLLDQLVFTNYINRDRKGILANINLNPIIKYLKDNSIETITLSNGLVFNLKQILEELRDSTDVPDASLSLSGLLSAATDNAKELILAKINATSKYVDIYNYLISIGTSFSEIADIMTSQIFNHIVKLTDGNIFDKSTYKFSLESAINFYLNRDILPYIDRTTLNKVLEKYIKNSSERIPLLTISDDLSSLEDISKKLLTDIKNFKSRQKSLVEDYEYYDDLYDGWNDEDAEYEGSISTQSRDFNKEPLTKADYINTYKVVKSFIKRINNLNQMTNSKKQLDILAIINDDIIPATKEMEALGGMAGINQGIRTNSFDKYKYIKRIENYINNKIIAYNNSHSDKLTEFSLMKFLSDSYMQQIYITDYDKIKNTYNILNAISTVPHFNEMFKVLYLDNTSINWLSEKNRLETKIANRVLVNPTQQLNQAEYKELTRYTNDILIYNWIKTLNKSFTIPIGQKYFVNHLGKVNINTLNNFSIQLNTVEGLATFKRTMDEFIIPTLKEDPNFKDNQFIKALTWGVYDNYVTKKPNIYYKLPINMMQIDNSVKNQTVYEAILSDFNKLNGKTYNEWNIIDLFYLYNLLVNKDAFGQKSMTRLFEDITKVNANNLLATQFYKYLSDLDYSETNILDFNVFDLKYRLAPITTNKNKFGIEENTNSLYLKDVFEDKTMYENIDPSTIDISYFTLNMPLLSKSNSSRVKEIIKEIKEPTTEYYKRNLDSREIITAIVNRFKEIYQTPIQLIYDEDIETSIDELTKNSEAFIDNGEVFINLDKADVTAPLHEYTHLVLAGIKASNPEIYYNILSSISTHPMYNTISKNPIYKNKHGSDLDEEVFATLLGEYFKNKVYKWPGNEEFTNTDQITKSVINKLFQIDSKNLDVQSLMNSSLDSLLEVFSSNLVAGTFSDFINIDAIRLNQRLATIKNQLIENETIKENCYE